MQQQQRDKIKGTLATVIFHGLLLYMLLYWGYQKPYPPPGEEGILISFGNTKTGRGTEQPMTVEPVRRTPPTSRGEQPYLTQDYEDAPAVKPQRNRQTPKPKSDRQQERSVERQQKPVEELRKENPNALFPRQGAASSQGQGDGANQGNQGTPNGSAGSNVGAGLGFSGSGASLEGRSLEGKLPEPDYRVQQSGKVIVCIEVDHDGNVMKAKAGCQRGSARSTLIDATLYEAAERAAKKAKFTPSPNGDARQEGIIIYVFTLK